MFCEERCRKPTFNRSGLSCKQLRLLSNYIYLEALLRRNSYVDNVDTRNRFTEMKTV